MHYLRFKNVEGRPVFPFFSAWICLYVPVANKWIHEYGQEFQHRCSLNPDE